MSDMCHSRINSYYICVCHKSGPEGLSLFMVYVCHMFLYIVLLLILIFNSFQFFKFFMSIPFITNYMVWVFLVVECVSFAFKW